jgi:hypothetical protein
MNFIHEIIIGDHQVPQVALTKRLELRNNKLCTHK